MAEAIFTFIALVFLGVVVVGMCYMAYDINHNQFKMSVIKSVLHIPVFYFFMMLESLIEGEDDIIGEHRRRIFQ